MGIISDLELYERVQNEDKEALELLYDRYERLLFSFSFKMLQKHELAEEAVQEVFIKLWRKKGMYNSQKGKFSSWLLTVTRNVCIDLIRTNKIQEVELRERDAVKLADGKNVEDTVQWNEERKNLLEAVAELSDDQKSMIEMFYFKGYSQQKIAEACSIPLGTVKGRIRLALQHLRKKYKKRGDKYGQGPL